ncbi:MAG: galactokinase [Anaerolineae bacterium]
MSLKERVVACHKDRFGTEPAPIVRAPGRVNLIGEHTDYNDGFVLPMAIDRAVWLTAQPRQDGIVHVYSLDFDQGAAFDLVTLEYEALGWQEYIKGVAWALQGAGHRLRGWNGVLAGDVPVGAGLSSSAALEMASARAFATVARIPWDATAMAKLAQKAENEWVGMKCGIMDQMISAAGSAGNALLIDCRSLETDAVPLPPDTSVVVLDTATRRGLVDSAYNERREQCEAGAAFFGVHALRDVSLEQFEAEGAGLDEVTRKRTRHVLTENDRTVRAAEALRRGDAPAMGQLMTASHASLRDDFEVSSRELNIMVHTALEEKSCHGARMTGAGFGGCAVALIEAKSAQAFTDRVAARYREATGLDPSLYVCSAAAGAEVVAPD